ncbi:BtpA/SgcQ family protein [Stetteria hydrogenophila]
MRPLLIGVVHLPPLPGSLAYALKGDPVDPAVVRGIAEYAVGEARKYVDAGFDAVIVENYGDKPFKRRVGRLIYASMAMVVAEVVERVDRPIGVSVLRNDADAAIGIAALAGASFARINALCSAREAPEGRIGPALAEAAEALARVKAPIDIIADVDVKHSLPAAPGYSAEDEIHECASRRGGVPVKAIVVSGKRTGSPPGVEYVRRLAEAARNAGFAVLVGSGVTPSLARTLLDVVDGFIVGSYAKVGGRTEAPVSMERALEIARAVGKRA